MDFKLQEVPTSNGKVKEDHEMQKIPESSSNENVNEESEKKQNNERSKIVEKENSNNVWKPELELVPFKLFYFSFFGAIGCVFPYLSLYYKQLGFSPNQIGLISGVRPLIGFCSGPLWGTMADRYRIRRILLLCSTFGWLAFLLGVGFVPPPEPTNETCPTELNFTPNATISDLLAKNITKLHTITQTSKPHKHHIVRKGKPGVSYRESLLEDRGWMFRKIEIVRVFVIIIILIICGEILQSPTSALADSGCLGHIGNQNLRKYGFQRCWGSIGFGLFSMIVGAVISTTRTTHTVCGIDVIFSDYRIAFYFFTGCMGLTFISAWFFEFKDETEENKRKKPAPDVLVAFRLFMSLHYGSWLVCIFFVGVCNGVIWGFLNWHLENIGASQFLIGCAVIINNISEVIMFFVMFPLLERIGYFTFMVLGVIGYAARFCVFASLTNPWFVLPVEILQGFTFAGVWGAMIGYLCTVIPGENMATMQGILHGVYWGLGSGSGSMIGGIVTEHFGARVTFWAFAIATVVNLVIFVITQKLAAKPLRKYEEIEN